MSLWNDSSNTFLHQLHKRNWAPFHLTKTQQAAWQAPQSTPETLPNLGQSIFCCSWIFFIINMSLSLINFQFEMSLSFWRSENLKGFHLIIFVIFKIIIVKFWNFYVRWLLITHVLCALWFLFCKELVTIIFLMMMEKIALKKKFVACY